MYDSVGLIPPEPSDSPAGSQPNEAYGTSGLNWRGAAGPAAAGRGPGWAGPTPTARAATAAAASNEPPATQARRQRRRARPRRWARWASIREPAGSPAAICANSARSWDSLMARPPGVDPVLRCRGGLVTGTADGPASRTGAGPWPQRPAHRLKRPGRLALDRPR